MANKSYRYTILWGWREEGNKSIEDMWAGTATSVPRAISKLIQSLNEVENEHGQRVPVADEEKIKASEVFVLDVRCAELTQALEHIQKMS